MRNLLVIACVTLLACGDDDGGADATTPSDATPSDATTGDGVSADGAPTDTAASDVGSDDATSTDSAMLGPAERLCMAAATHDGMCGEPLTPRDECLMDRGCVVTLIRADAIEAIAACDEARECDVSDDTCFVPELIGLESSPAAMAYGESCMSRRTECSADPFPDDFCFVNIASDPTIERLAACLSMECGDIGACIGDILDCA